MDTVKRNQTVGYVRVSTIDQNTARQNEQLKDYSVDELFTDYASGKDTNRPQLQAALKYLRKGDVFIVHSMDRLARNLDDLRKIVNDLTIREVEVRFIKESLTFNGEQSSISNLMLSIMGAFAEFERSLIRERQREGITIAKKNGLYKGRKPSLNDVKIEEVKLLDKNNFHKNRADLALKLGISRPTLYKYLNGFK